MAIPQPVVRSKLRPQNQPHVVIPTSRQTISVGCKLPNGMHLDIREFGQPTQRVTLKGINSLTEGALIRPATISGYAITDNVPKEFFEHWMDMNKHHPAVTNNLIFAHTQKASVIDMAEEFSDIRHGLEPIDPRAPAKGITTRQDND